MILSSLKGLLWTELRWIGQAYALIKIIGRTANSLVLLWRVIYLEAVNPTEEERGSLQGCASVCACAECVAAYNHVFCVFLCTFTITQLLCLCMCVKCTPAAVWNHFSFLIFSSYPTLMFLSPLLSPTCLITYQNAFLLWSHLPKWSNPNFLSLYLSAWMTLIGAGGNEK